MKTKSIGTILLLCLLNAHLSLLAQTTENKNTGYKQSPMDVETRRYCMTLQLKNNPDLIAEYEEWHKPENVWKEVTDGIKEIGIIDSEIYRSGITLFMILTVPADFNFEEQMTKLADLPRQADWEEFMTKFQATQPGASSAEKWQKMERIFKLPE